MYSFSYLEPVCCFMSSSNCCFLICIQVSQEASQVVWSSHLFQNFPQFTVVHKAKGFGIVNEPHDPAIPLQAYPEKTIPQKAIYTLMFIEALLTTHRTWKKYKCPSVEEWIKKMWYIYVIEYYSTKKKIMPLAATWMDLLLLLLLSHFSHVWLCATP